MARTFQGRVRATGRSRSTTIGSGHAGKFAALIGQILADLATTGSTTAWHEALYEAAAPLLSRAQDVGAARPDIGIAELLMFLTAATRTSPQSADRAVELLMEGVLPRSVPAA